MSAPSTPPPIEEFHGRAFSFYPPILNIEHNEWTCQGSNWSEVQVRNTKSQADLWIPRRYLGEISRIDEPVMIVGLRKELEYKAGQVWPHERRVLELPRAGRARAAEAPAAKAPPFSGGLESSTESRIGRLILAALVMGVALCFVVISLFRGSREGSRVSYEPIFQSSLGLNGQDDYHAVVRKLGLPMEDHWRNESGEMQYRLLRYPKLYVVLMGVERDKALYIGAMDSNWKPVDSVQLPGGGNTSSMLRSLKRF